MPQPDTERPPSLLYKYRSLRNGSRDFTRDIIENSRLWCGAASDLNDPFDCRPIPILSPDLPMRRIQLHAVLNSVIRNVPQSEINSIAEAMLSDPTGLDTIMAKAVDEMRARIGVLSLSASGTIPAMWRNYADDHHGICLGFGDGFGDPPNQHRMFSLAKRVDYVPERPKIVAIPGPSADFIRAFLHTKTDRWNFEEEWRLCDPRRVGSVGFHKAALGVIIFGHAITEADRHLVLEWVSASGTGAQLMQSQLAEDGETVTLVPL